MSGESNVEGFMELNDIDGAAYVKNNWLELEDGIRVWFGDDPGSIEVKSTILIYDDIIIPYTDQFHYRSRDYWLIPARVATGNVEWPLDKDKPKSLSPHGVQHHYALLYMKAPDGKELQCRRKFNRLGEHF